MNGRVSPIGDMSQSLELHNFSPDADCEYGRFYKLRDFSVLIVSCFVVAEDWSRGVFFSSPPLARFCFHRQLQILFSDLEDGLEDGSGTAREINRGFRQLPSRSAQRSMHNTSTRRRGSVRRGSMRPTHDVEVINIEDFNDEVEDDMANPKELTQPMSAKRRYR